MKVDGTEASPMKAVSEELDALRHLFREALEVYAARLDSQITEVQATVNAEIGKEKVDQAKIRDLRDMFTLLRRCSEKCEKGRRKNLKKIESGGERPSDAHRALEVSCEPPGMAEIAFL